MIHKSKNPVFSSLVSSNKSMKQYMKRSRMQSLGVWATEVDIIAAASLLNANIYVYAQCGDSYKWLKHSANEANCGLHQDA